MDARNHHRVLAFGDFRFDPSTGELTRGHTRVPIAHQPAKVLELLLRNAGTIVSREEVIATVWGDGTTVIYADNVNFCVRQIRQALGESAKRPRLIETFPKRGYRFTGDVRCLDTARASEPGRARTWLGLAAALAIAAIALTGSSSPSRVATVNGPIAPAVSAALPRADTIVQLTLGSIEAHLWGSPCPWPRYWSARRGLRRHSGVISG